MITSLDIANLGNQIDNMSVEIETLKAQLHVIKGGNRPIAEEGNFTTVPRDILQTIFFNLSNNSLAMCSCVNRRWKTIARSVIILKNQRILLSPRLCMPSFDNKLKYSMINAFLQQQKCALDFSQSKRRFKHLNKAIELFPSVASVVSYVAGITFLIATAPASPLTAPIAEQQLIDLYFCLP